MAHVVRKFEYVLKEVRKEERPRHGAVKAVMLIQQLYKIEEGCRRLSPQAHRADQSKQLAKDFLKSSMSTSQTKGKLSRKAHPTTAP